MCNEFISDEKDLLDELKDYSLNANTFRSSESITELNLNKSYVMYMDLIEDVWRICH